MVLETGAGNLEIEQGKVCYIVNRNAVGGGAGHLEIEHSKVCEIVSRRAVGGGISDRCWESRD